MLSPTKYQPDYIFLRHVPVKRVHIFTAIQIASMAIMWFFKSVKSIALLFPLMVRTGPKLTRSRELRLAKSTDALKKLQSEDSSCIWI